MASASTYIIIVTYNGLTWLKRCLKSCGNYPVVVVDNASTDGTVGFIEQQFPNITLLKQETNLGFGQANNLGISYALNHGAKQVFLLNQDAYLVDDALEQLVTFQKTHPEYWVLSPLHVTPGLDRLDENFSHYVNYKNNACFYSDYVLGHPIKPVYEVPFVNAAAWLVSLKCLNTVGGFDPLFFHYGEDDNYCQRVLFHGGKIGIIPNVKVIHDRVDREKHPIEPFSEAYYQHKLKNFKKRHANVNTFDVSVLNKKISSYKKPIIKAFCKGQFKRFKRLKHEQQLFITARQDILKSVEQNKQQGATYLPLTQNKTNG
ncbi:glycosyltransferase family 2 protein [Mangrovimonas cancribranchiae]|uniref:Glycosyltransferase family 2 protein n=1 Tax=Mangrovimonas cancribranchiae TaxID=3080055 RepID=A0AAU6P155_9FLAO